MSLLLFGIYEVVTGSAEFKVDKDCDSINVRLIYFLLWIYDINISMQDEAIAKILTAVRNCKKINKQV